MRPRRFKRLDTHWFQVLRQKRYKENSKKIQFQNAFDQCVHLWRGIQNSLNSVVAKGLKDVSSRECTLGERWAADLSVRPDISEYFSRLYVQACSSRSKPVSRLTYLCLPSLERPIIDRSY